MSSTPQPPVDVPDPETRAMPPPFHHRASIPLMVEFISPLTSAPLQWRGDALIGPQGEAVPVVRGIPRFVPSDSYASGFGLQWNAHAETQLDSRTGTHLSQARLERCLGMPLTALRGKTVLEAGCG